MEQIRYLKQQEKQNTRAMYGAVFPEDSKEFVDYYYQWKTKDNEILVMEDNAGYEVMIHLNPYTVCMNGRRAEVPYIVAVATRQDCRRQGKMQQVMKHVLQDLQKSHCPFAFLLPADSAYYRGQGFVFAPKSIADAEAGELKKGLEVVPAAEREKVIVGETDADAGSWSYVSLRSGDDTRMQQAAETANTILTEQYDMYLQRDKGYYERLIEETAAERGEVLLIREKERCIGILTYGGEEQADIKELLLFSQYKEKRNEICNRIFGRDNWKEEEMQMMYRITDLQALDGMLKGEQEILIAEITDSMVKENNGIWRIEWNPAGGDVTRIGNLSEETGKIQHMDIAEVTAKIVEKMSIFIREWV